MKRGNMDIQTHQKEDNVMRHREKTSICKPRREARSRFPLPALRTNHANTWILGI